MASLWDRMGGTDMIRPLCNDLYKMHSTDPLTAPWFGNPEGPSCAGNIRKPDEIMENVFTFFSAGIGGPFEYKGNDMKTAHAHMSIPEHAFHALTNHVMVGMEKHKTGGEKEREEVLAILTSLKPDVMDGTYKKKKKEKKTPAPKESLWDRMGGEEKIRPLCNELYEMHSTDPLTAAWFGKGKDVHGNKRTPGEVAENVFTFFSAGIGGPFKYEGNDMKAAHMHMVISGPAWHALTNHVAIGMEKHKTGGSAEREEVYAILMSLKADVMAGTKASFQPKVAPAPDGATEMKVTAKRSAGFYAGSACSFLRGVDAKPAQGDKEATEAKPAVNYLRISGLGEAINTAVGAAAKVEADGLGSIVKIQTCYPEMEGSGHGVAQILIDVKKK